MLVLDALCEWVRSSHGGLAVAFMLVGLVHVPAAVAQDKPYDCGPSHASEVRETLRLRDPGAATSSGDSPSALILDRALIIEDFLRLRGEEGDAVDSALQRIEEARLRDARDSGRTSAEVCEVVRFMHGHYLRTGKLRAPADGKQAAAPQKSDTPGVVSAPRVKPAVRRSGSARVTRQELQPAVQVPPPKRAPKPSPATKAATRATLASSRARAPGRAPAAVAQPVPEAAADDVAALDRTEETRPATQADANARRNARALIAEIETQLKVPRYLTYREVRIEAATLAKDELKQRQAASLRASARVVSLLTRLSLDPALREAFQASLGAAGRARIEEDILLAFKSVPDPQQRERALSLWSELEAAARWKR